MAKKTIQYLPLIILFVIALLTIFFQFNQIPINLNDDEVDFAKLALSLKQKPFTVYSPQATGHATLYFYIILASFKLFGINNFALRFPSAIFGILGVLMFYLIMKKVFKKSIIYHLLSIIFLTSHWYLNFTRFSFEATFLLLLELTSIYFLFQCFKTLKWSYLILSGIFAGLAFNSYLPGRIFFILPLFFLFFKALKSNYSKICFLFITPFIITVLPLTIYLSTHKDIRFSQQFYIQNKKLNFTKKTQYLLKNVKATALMFNFRGDMNGRHNYPGKAALNPILGIFFVLGLFICLMKIKSVYNQFFLFYFFISLVPTLFTNPVENPNMLRTFTAIPSVVYFIGMSVSTILTKYKSWWFGLMIFFLLSLSSVYELRTYFIFQSRVVRNSFGIKCSIEKLIDKDKPYPKECLVSRNEF